MGIANIRKMFREELPRYSLNQIVRSMKIYGDVIRSYEVIDMERRFFGKIRRDAINIAIQNIEIYEKEMPMEVRGAIERDVGCSVERIKSEIMRAKPIAE